MIDKIPAYKINRIYTPNTLVRGKDYLTPKEVELLLSKPIVIEEKVDGKQVKFEINGYILFGEDLTNTHTIYYQELPSPVLGIDIYSVHSKKFLDLPEKIRIFLQIGMIPVNVIYVGQISRENFQEFLENLLFSTKSSFKTKINPKMVEVIRENEEVRDILSKENFIEGIVVKNYETQLFGKIVNPTFEKIIDFVGRYEKYPYKNRWRVYSKKEYERYISRIIEKVKEYRKEVNYPEFLAENMERNYMRYLSFLNFVSTSREYKNIGKILELKVSQ